ncbi:MAG: molybdopterin molybdotransferase MoeA [Campylobacteraceae bacterium]|nr:molybdopterin molybdotransferase MoeA [Campylobacteraceae bacterium]
MTVKESLDLIFGNVEELNLTKKVNLNECVGEILASDLKVVKDLPCFDNSALDGYAFDYAEVGSTLKIVGTIYAGDKTEYILKKGECYKIMTGAMMPKGANTVVRLEDAKFIKDESGEELLKTDESIKKFDAFRLKGEETKVGEILLNKGEVLTPAKAMLLASQGINEVEVFTRPRVALFSSGDELKEPWEVASEYEIYNANASGIKALLNDYECDYKGIITDDLDSTINAIKNNQNYDVIVTSGGASAGDKDYMDEALQSLGYRQLFDYIQIKPGRPTKCYIKDKNIVFVLPGNPTAAFLLCFLVVLPTLKRISGQNEPYFKTIKAKFNGNLKLKSGRTNATFGIYEDGKFSVIDDNKFGSGTIKPLSKATHLHLSDVSQSGLSDGETIKIIEIS